MRRRRLICATRPILACAPVARRRIIGAMATDAALLSDVPWFQDLDTVERDELATHVDIVHHPKDAILWRAGDPGGSLLVVRAGEVEVFYTDPTGHRTVLERVGVGGFFGDISLLDGGTRTASVVVLSDLEALRVDQNDLELLVRKHP